MANETETGRERTLAPELATRVGQALRARRAALEETAGSAGPPPMVEVLDRALARLDDGELGRCDVCDDAVESRLLELDFTSRVCLTHYTGAELRELERDLECAAAVQKSALPADAPRIDGWEVATLVQPARIVSGDAVAFYRAGGGRQGIAVADVMGKGVAAGLLAASLQSAVRILGPEHDDPGDLLAGLDRVLRYNLNVLSFVTVFALEIDVASGRARYASAGHEPALVRRLASRQVEELAPTGPAIGLDPEATFGSRSIPFDAGDLVLLYTDGLVESRAPRGQLLGAPRLARLVAQHAGGAAGLVHAAQSAALSFGGGALSDDLTLVALRRCGVPAETIR